MTYKLAFLLSAYDDQTIRERSRVVEDLVRYVLQGARNSRGESHPQAAAFTANVRSELLRSYQPHAVVTSGKKRVTTPGGNTSSLVVEIFNEAAEVTRLSRLVVPHFTDDALSRYFAIAFNVITVDVLEQCDPTVEAAYGLALNTLRQIETRLVALTAISMMLTQRIDRYGYNVITGTDALQSTLYQNHTRCLLTIAMFGGLLGGQRAKEAAMMVAGEMCYNTDPNGIKYSVIEYLHSDFRHPGRYLSSLDTSFLSDIEQRYRDLQGSSTSSKETS